MLLFLDEAWKISVFLVILTFNFAVSFSTEQMFHVFCCKHVCVVVFRSGIALNFAILTSCAWWNMPPFRKGSESNTPRWVIFLVSRLNLCHFHELLLTSVNLSAMSVGGGSDSTSRCIIDTLRTHGYDTTSHTSWFNVRALQFLARDISAVACEWCARFAFSASGSFCRAIDTRPDSRLDSVTHCLAKPQRLQTTVLQRANNFHPCQV